MGDQKVASYVNEMLQCAEFFPEHCTAQWLATSFNQAKVPAAHSVIDLFVNYKLRRYDADAETLKAEIAAALSGDEEATKAALRYLQELRLAARESKWINHILCQRLIKHEWYDIAMSALADEEVIAIAAKDASLSHWIASLQEKSPPPSFCDTIPPLGLADIRRLRQRVDRFAKRTTRLKHNVSGNALEATAILRTTLSDIPPDYETLSRLSEAIESMSKDKRAAVYMRVFEEATLRQVQAALGISSLTAAHRLVRSAVSDLRKAFLKDDK